MEQELVYIKDLVLSKLRDVLPEIPLEDIRASLHRNHRSTTVEKAEAPKPWLDAPNTDDEITYANESTKNLSGDLAEEMKRVILLGLRAERLAGDE